MKICVLADVHFDHPNCYREEFLEAISLIAPKMDVIVLNGDFLDSTSNKTRKLFEEFLELAKKENFLTKLFFVRSSSHHDGVLDEFWDLAMNDYAEFSTNIGKVICIHGNKVGLHLDEKGSEELAAIKAKEILIEKGRKWLPKITQEHHVIFSHLHRRFYNERKRVYGTGCWIPAKDRRSEKVTMIIDDEDKNDTISNNTLAQLREKYQQKH
ncbi:MAG: metallophosphoesterase [Candidatus Heimdallarchaeota archaeon]